MSVPTTIEQLHSWADQGWLRRLDSALAALLLELDPSAPSVLQVCTALLTHMEGRGHTCLPLRLLQAQPNAVLGWTGAAQTELLALWQQLPPSLPDWLNTLHASSLVRCVDNLLPPTPADQGQPLVLGGTATEPLLYLRRYWQHEQQVARDIRQRCAASHPVDMALAARWLDRLFGSATPATSTTATTADAATSDAPDTPIDWQRLACAVALRAGLTVITGGPGTGKTYTAARLLALLFAISAAPERLRVALAAPTGKAAARLRQSIDSSLQELSTRLGNTLNLAALTQRMGAARTLHSLLGARSDTRALRFHAGNPLDIDILIVDEASMIHLEMMSALLQALPASATLILLGDKDQLASVEAGAVLGDLCRDAAQGQYSAQTARYALTTSGQAVPAAYLAHGSTATALAQQTVMLRASRRFGGLIGQLAQAVNAGHSDRAHALVRSDTSGVLHATRHPSIDTVLQLAVHGRAGASACYADYLRLIHAPASRSTQAEQHTEWVTSILRAFDRFRLLCAVHDGDWGTRGLNQSVQRALEQAQLLKPRGEWFAGRPVMVTRNDPSLDVFNGDVGVTLPGPTNASALRVYFLDGDTLRSVGVSRLAYVETAFAMTVHKSQGSEFLHAALVLPPGGGKVLTRELVYTGITRARDHFTLVEAQDGLLQSAIESRSIRASGLEAQLADSNTDTDRH